MKECSSKRLTAKLLQEKILKSLFSSLMKKMVLFAPKDIVLKLPTSLAVGGSARRSNQLRFQFHFAKF